ncbi:UNVERIFIED_CONTAM: hypothetical protein GTU68_019351 [Idotea baltica]|nr:hypothetical protein [Idotea baltica]
MTPMPGPGSCGAGRAGRAKLREGSDAEVHAAALPLHSVRQGALLRHPRRQATLLQVPPGQRDVCNGHAVPLGKRAHDHTGSRRECNLGGGLFPGGQMVRLVQRPRGVLEWPRVPLPPRCPGYDSSGRGWRKCFALPESGEHHDAKPLEPFWSRHRSERRRTGERRACLEQATRSRVHRVDIQGDFEPFHRSARPPQT